MLRRRLMKAGDSIDGHEYVEIAGLKWATMNIGANSVTDYGQYFSWGDTQGYTADQMGPTTEGKKYFGWEDYKYGNGTGNPSARNMTKYNPTDGKTVLEASDDAARANWGGQWRMPTTEEFEALGNAVNTEWTDDYQGSGVAGRICTDKTDSSKVLFFPAADEFYNGSFRSEGDGYYWSSSVYNNGYLPQKYAYCFKFWDSSVRWDFVSNRREGISVRGVVG